MATQARKERQPKAPRTCKDCPATLARNAKGGRCRKCYDRARAMSAAEREVMKRWRPFLTSWKKLADAIDEAARAEVLLLKYGRLAREGVGGKWRLTDPDIMRRRDEDHRLDTDRFRKGAVLFLANVRGIAIVYARGVCERLDPNQVKVTAAS